MKLNSALSDSHTTAVRLLALGLALTVGGAVLTGCTPQINHRGYYQKAGTLSQVHEGMPRSEVEGIMGSPSTTASINYQGDSYYYITSVTQARAFLNPVEIKREIIAIRFNREDQVQSVAQYGLEDGRIIDMNTRKTLVAGEEFNIVRELFRNLPLGQSSGMLNRKL